MTNTQGRPHSRYGAWHRLPLLLIMVTLFSGCAAFSWIPGIGDDDDDEENTDPAKLVDFDAEVDIERQWKVKVGDGLGKKYIRLQPSIAAERIVAADAYGTVAAFDRFSGQKIWQQKIGEEERRVSGLNRFLDRSDGGFVSGGVGVGEGLVLLGTTRGNVIALALSDGSERWRTYVGSEIGAMPVAAQGRVFAQTIVEEISTWS